VKPAASDEMSRIMPVHTHEMATRDVRLFGQRSSEGDQQPSLVVIQDAITDWHEHLARRHPCVCVCVCVKEERSNTQIIKRPLDVPLFLNLEAFGHAAVDQYWQNFAVGPDKCEGKGARLRSTEPHLHAR
jgi:hypothetical protein